MKAVKGNKEYSIDESQKNDYQSRGFDIKDDDGKVIAYGRGKTVPYEDYEKIKSENGKLTEELKKLSEENEKLNKKLKESKAETKSSGKEGKKDGEQ